MTDFPVIHSGELRHWVTVPLPPHCTITTSPSYPEESVYVVAMLPRPIVGRSFLSRILQRLRAWLFGERE